MEKEETKLRLIEADPKSEISVPYADGGIKAGFPSPAQDYLTESIDLNRELIQHRESTFYARIDGDSLTDAGICDGDLVIIDKALEARNGDYVAAYIDGEFTLKRFKMDTEHNCAWLIPANKAYKPIKVTQEDNFAVWGVMTYCIKKFRDKE